MIKECVNPPTSINHYRHDGFSVKFRTAKETHAAALGDPADELSSDRMAKQNAVPSARLSEVGLGLGIVILLWKGLGVDRYEYMSNYE